MHGQIPIAFEATSNERYAMCEVKRLVGPDMTETKAMPFAMFVLLSSIVVTARV